MNQGPFIFLGVFCTMALSWYAMVFGPTLQLGTRQIETVESTGSRYPSARAGLAQQGREVYRANGCNYCHTQQVRPKSRGSDFDRGWGIRPSVAQDYVLDHPVMLGRERIGQDLMNIGVRQTNQVWHLLHLYNPQLTSPGSVMPPYRFLFQKQKIKGQPSPDALKLDGKTGLESGYEIVPKQEARALVEYLLSMDAQLPLFEAPLPPKRQSGDTNATPAQASTNASGTTPAVK